MATSRLNVSSCQSPTSRRLDCEISVGLRAMMVMIRYEQTVAAPRCHLVGRANEDQALVVNAEGPAGEIPKKNYPGENKVFVEEMRFVVMRMHPRDLVKEVKRESNGHVSTWEFTVERYLKFLVDNTGPKNTGVERSANLGKDLEWFKEQGYEIPESMAAGKAYSQHLKDRAEKDPPALIFPFYNINFAHSAGDGKIGTMVFEKILDNKELEFYKWDDQLSELLQNVTEELNEVAELWTREEKNHCLEETEKSFKSYWEIFRFLLS